MTQKKPAEKNQIIPSTTINLNDGYVAIVDSDLEEFLRTFQWRAIQYQRCFYARASLKTSGEPRQVSMHRLVAKTPAGEVCHHRNRNTLDNRRANLCNLSKHEHHRIHSDDTILYQFAPGSSEVKVGFEI